VDGVVTTVGIGGRQVGPGQPCFVIAEAGVNHNGDVSLARDLVDAAVSAGADAVKFQIFKVDKVTTTTAPKAEYQIQNTGGASESQSDMLRPLELPPGAFVELSDYCAMRGIMFLASPFDHDSVDVLAALDVPAFKVGSGELTNWPLLEHIAGKGKPVILSTGMAFLSEVDESLRVVQSYGATDVIVLHCLSSYPANPREVNLRAMQTMASVLPVPVGYSDHTTGTEIPMAAVALGAPMLEKHLTLANAMPGPDHAASLEPDQFKVMVDGIRDIEAALGDGVKRPMPSELNTADVARRSLVAGADIAAGTSMTPELIEVLRPGTGLPPSALPYILGRRLGQDVRVGTLLSLDMFD
jgi:N-acetylneuraminate synthase/N,N'-diacetyllegionaminate synthase